MPAVAVKIKGHEFLIDDKYEEGHTLTAVEAAALNQARRGAVAGVCRTAVLDALEEGNGTLSDAVKAELQKAIEERAAKYEFGQRSTGTGKDPVHERAVKLAFNLVKDAIRAQGHRIPDVGHKRIKELAEEAVEKNPVLLEKAAEQLAQEAALTDGLSIEV